MIQETASKIINEPHVQATVKSAPALVPGVVTGAADWLGLINAGLSAMFMALSIAYLLWRWRVAYIEKSKEHNGGQL